MYKTVFKVDKMDCPCEENLIRLKLQEISGIVNQQYDLKERTVTIFHTGNFEEVEEHLASLNLGSKRLETIESQEENQIHEDNKQRKVFWTVLIINFAFFILEITTGFISNSMGLIADSLDMLADSFVYGLSLFAVGAAVTRKKKVAMWCGYFQLALALLGFIEVIKRFIGMEELPDFQTMIGISILALIANVICLLLLQRTKSKDAHIQASIIFSSNDVIINTGVILAGFLVWKLNTGLPDLIIGTIVFLIVIRGAFRILKLAK